MPDRPARGEGPRPGRAERVLARLLLRLLPGRIGQDVFEPAWHDLQMGRLLEQQKASAKERQARAPRGPRSSWFLLRLILLYLDCWRVALAGLPHTLRRRRSAKTTKPGEPAAMFLYYLRHAFLRLRREPAFTVAAVLTLALGVGANVAVFAVVEAVLLRPLPYENAEGLVIVNHRDLRTGVTKEFIAIGDHIDIAQRQQVFEQFLAYGNFQTTIFGEGEPYQVDGLQAEPGLFELMRLRPAAGRAFEDNDGKQGAAPVMMLGYELWQSRFGGDPNVVGRSLRVGQLQRTIVGVAPRNFRFPPNSGSDVILPMALPQEAPASRKAGWTFGLARLKPGQTPETATANLTEIARQLEQEYPRYNEASTYYALSLRDALVGNTKPALVLLLAAVAVVLLIACANVANLQLARSLGRRREIAVRLALGAGRGRLATMLLTESLALALLASLVGVLFALWGVRALVALVPDSVDVPGLANVHMNGAVLAFALGITGAAALLFGLLAAMTVRLEHAADVLVSAGRATMGRLARRATSGLVIGEVALAIVLLIGAGLILRSFSGLLAVDPGFRYDQVMTLTTQIPADRYTDANARSAFYARAFEALRARPEVREVGAGVVVPLTGNNWTVPFERAEYPVPAGERPPDVGWQSASGGFFETLQIPLVAGRLFDERDRPQGKPVVIISEAIQRTYFGNESAVGREVKLGEQRAEIVGVVGNIRRAGLRDDPRADMYFPFELNPGNQITLFVRTNGDPARALNVLQSTLRGIEPDIAFLETQSLSAIASESVRVTELVLWLLGVFAASALVLAAVGIYGVMSYVVRQRTREIGTRMAVGATRGAILWLVLRQGAVVAVTGIALGLAIGLAAARSLSSILFGVSATDPLTLALATTLLAATTMIACYLPARRASSVDPARTLAQQ
jgi:putative ABC transport system permease protein